MIRFEGRSNYQKMYGLETQLTQKIPIADTVGIHDSLKDGVLVPSNSAELIIPLVSDLEIKMIGTLRNSLLKKSCGYFFKPRGRGMEVFGRASFISVKVHPGYTKQITKNLEAVSHGIYRVCFDEKLLGEIQRMVHRNRVFQVNDVLEDLFGLEDIDLNAVIIDSIDLIRSSTGSISIKEIYTDLNVSKSTLEQRFNKDIGLTPKEFCKIEKLNGFIQTYMNSESTSLTELTYQCGYYDQSHLIKDFRYFLNMSPKEFFS